MPALLLAGDAIEVRLHFPAWSNQWSCTSSKCSQCTIPTVSFILVPAIAHVATRVKGMPKGAYLMEQWQG
jgi:hypothetical protein